MAAKNAEKKTKVDINAENKATEDKKDSTSEKASYEELEAKIAAAMKGIEPEPEPEGIDEE